MQIRCASAVYFELLFHVVIKGFSLFQRVVVGKNGIRMFRRQLFTVVRCPRLKNNRATLRGAANIQRPGDLKKIPLMVKGVQFFRIKELAALFIAHKGIVFPGIP